MRFIGSEGTSETERHGWEWSKQNVNYYTDGKDRIRGELTFTKRAGPKKR